MKTKNIVFGLATVALSIAIPQAAKAALITGISATADMGNYSNGSPITNVINGTGLTGGVPSLTGNHATSTTSNAWSGATLGNVTFNLNGLYSLAGFSFWNRNDGQLFAVKDVNFQSSTDGLNFTDIANTPNQFLNIISGAPQQSSFAAVNATHVRLQILSNYGGKVGNNFTPTFNEIQFDGVATTAVPEPLTIVGTLVGGTAALRLRKKLKADSISKN